MLRDPSRLTGRGFSTLGKETLGERGQQPASAASEWKPGPHGFTGAYTTGYTQSPEEFKAAMRKLDEYEARQNAGRDDPPCGCKDAA
jgi:hypothetical protein